jgi:hypothetical protein
MWNFFAKFDHTDCEIIMFEVEGKVHSFQHLMSVVV